MSIHPTALPHSNIQQVLPEVFFVTGAMETVLMDMDWRFSRNMIIVRENDSLILINSVRLTEEGLAELDQLGTVTDIVRIGSLHDKDDAFYTERYASAEYWGLEDFPNQEQMPRVTKPLIEGGDLPISDASLFTFKTTKLPESILCLDREGGILIACDALQNWLEPDEFFSPESTAVMTEMGFFTPANIGPVWMKFAEPEAEDFVRLKKLTFNHVLCGHGEPLKDNAYQEFSATFKKIFDID